MNRAEHRRQAEGYLRNVQKWPDAEDAEMLAIAAVAHALLASTPLFAEDVR